MFCLQETEKTGSALYRGLMRNLVIKMGEGDVKDELYKCGDGNTEKQEHR